MGGMERLPRSPIQTTSATLKATADLYGNVNSLQAHLCRHLATDNDLIEIAAHGLEALQAHHLFSCVQYLLFRDPNDPLARFYPSLTKTPSPPENAYPDFARFCRAHRDEIIKLLHTRTVQATQAERCQFIAPLLSHVATLTGEPLNLIEIGCSAGILLTFDKYAYDVNGQYNMGPTDAPLSLKIDAEGAPPLRIPEIGRRVGIDLRLVDAKSEDERRWLQALCAPESLQQQRHLATALAVVADTDIEFFEGDALDALPKLLEQDQGPLCIFHSACVVYWSEEAQAELDALLLKASPGRTFYRLSIEPDIKQRLRDLKQSGDRAPIKSEVALSRYFNGAVETTIVADLFTQLSRMIWRN
jgi:hypothetical protein